MKEIIEKQKRSYQPVNEKAIFLLSKFNNDKILARECVEQIISALPLKEVTAEPCCELSLDNIDNAIEYWNEVYDELSR